MMAMTEDAKLRNLTVARSLWLRLAGFVPSKLLLPGRGAALHIAVLLLDKLVFSSILRANTYHH